MQSRLPRFKRIPTAFALQLTDRDRNIIRLVYRHRFLRSSHVIGLLDGRPQPILRRLQLLYHHGFLDRPKEQIEYFHRGGSRPIVYGLGRKGALLLKQEPGAEASVFRSFAKRSPVKRLFLEHAVLVSDILVTFELACRKIEGVRLLTGEDLPRVLGVRPKFNWKIKANNGNSLGVVPDAVFAIVCDDEAWERNPTYFFVEADRGTMPVTRRNLTQTSLYRKFLAYQATWSQGLHRSKFGINRFRVLTVTTSPARVDSLVNVCSQLKSGHGLFLFCDQATFQSYPDILMLPWKTGRPEETSTILPQAANLPPYRESA